MKFTRKNDKKKQLLIDSIDHIIYINLKNRKDRLRNIEKVLSFFPENKKTRLEAIYNENGATGCALSHLAALELAQTNNWENCLILEDDIDWSPEYKEGITLFEKIIKKPYDVIMLATTFSRYRKASERIIGASSTSAYLVNSSYYLTLIKKIKKYMKTTKKPIIDIFYREDPQQNDIWYGIRPNIFYQKASYSNIEKKDVDYKERSNI
jgi:GR25 family glycosyltransferase involved in LPS biosynthesis